MCKAYEIVSSIKINIFIRLGGFQQLMRFLGLTGYLIEGRSLSTALETIYVPLMDDNMVTVKARSVHCHTMSASTVLSTIREGLWKRLLSEQQAQIIEIYGSSSIS